MSDNGTIVLDGLIISGGGSGGGGTAATTSFAPTATINATNVQDAVEEVDAKAIAADAAAEAVAGDLADTVINGVAIAGKNNTCADLGIQGKLTEGSGIQIDEVVTAPVKFLMSTKNDVNFPVEDISGAPLGFLQMNPTKYVLGPELYANSTIKSIGSKYDQYDPAYIAKGSFDWSKLNMGTGPFTVTFRRLLTKDNIDATDNYIIFSDRRGSSYRYGIRSDGSFWCDYWNLTAGIPIIKNVIEEIKLTRLDDGTYEWYKNGTKLGTDQNILKGLTVDFSFGAMLRLGDLTSSYETVGFFISGLTITNTPYTGGNYTLSVDYPTTGVIVTTNNISAVAGTIAFDNTNTGISATNIQDAVKEVDNKLSAKANLVDGKVPLTELPELGGTAADITPITATSGSVSLEANKAYKMTAQGDITITLPATETLDADKVNKTNLHLRNEKLNLSITFATVMMFKDGKDFSAIAPGHYYICFEYNSLAERWEADIKQQKFSGATVRKVADFSSEIPAGYAVSDMAEDGGVLGTAANNTADLVFPLQDTPYKPSFPRMQWTMKSGIRYKIKMPSARKILSYSVTGWAEDGSLTGRILKSFRVWAATTDVDITVSNWKDNCKLIDEQINAFTSSDHNVTKKFAISLDVNAVCIIIEPTANQGGDYYVCLGQIRFFGE